MKKASRWMVGLAALALAGAVHATPASAESVRVLIDLTHTRALVDSMMSNIETSIRQGTMSAISQRSSGQPLTDAQRATIDRIVVRAADVMRTALRWEDLEPEYVKLYVDTFEQDEIDGMIAFYRTPTGQALITKMPQVVQRSMAISQARMQALLPKIMGMVADETKALP